MLRSGKGGEGMTEGWERGKVMLGVKVGDLKYVEAR